MLNQIPIPSHFFHPSSLCFFSMSCLNLNKLLPARKAWRFFTTKVQTKLHKLHPSKTIKKPKNRLKATGKKSSYRRAFCIQSNVRCERFNHKPPQTHSYHSYHFQKRPSAVYIDQLFIEPAVSLVKEHLQPPIKAATAVAANKGYKKEMCPSTSSVKKPEIVDRPENIAGTSKDDGKLNENMHSADDMWESLVLASPQMNGINERAEEFISRFRAEMLLQERLARYL